MPSITYTVEIDPTKYRYLVQDYDGEVFAHVVKPEYREDCGIWKISGSTCRFIIKGRENEDPGSSLVDLRKPFTFINGILKQMEGE